MKKNLTLLLVTFYLTSISQPVVNIWRVSPDTICSGDTIKVYYKGTAPFVGGWPNTPDNSINYFFLQPGSNILWSGNWSLLKAKPKEHYTGLSVGDSCHVIKLVINSSVGTYSIGTNGTMSYLNQFIVKQCQAPCVITSLFTYSVGLNGFVTLTSTSTGANTYSWSNGATSENTSVTYTANGTYTVSLIASNSSTCTDTYTQTITISDINMVGIKEYELNRYKPVYYDIYGRESKETGVILLDPKTRRKIIILE